jgi:hypothetical protein
MTSRTDLGADLIEYRGPRSEDEIRDHDAILRQVNARRAAENITISQISRDIDVATRRLHAMLHGARPSTRPVIKKLRQWLERGGPESVDHTLPAVDRITHRLLFGDGHVNPFDLAEIRREIERKIK